MKTNITTMAIAMCMALSFNTVNAQPQQNWRQQAQQQSQQKQQKNSKQSQQKQQAQTQQQAQQQSSKQSQKRKTTTITKNNLPQQSQTTINNSFPSNEVKKVTQTTRQNDKTYEVKFKDGSSVGFNQKGEWNQVKTGSKTTVPSDMVPEKINKYVQQKYSNQKIKKIEKRTDGGYNVTLASGAALVFSAVYALVSASK